MAEYKRDEVVGLWMQGKVPFLAVLEGYLADFQDHDKRLAYLKALETMSRREGFQDQVEAIAIWRLRQQL
jgi:hypothetical protein